MRFKDKIFVVTGGGTGIGSCIAKDLCAEGGIVNILGRRSRELEKIKNQTASKTVCQGKIIPYTCDISSAEQVNNVFDAILKTTGTVNGLVNNAGVNPSRNDIINTDVTDWKNTLDINLSGAFNCSKAAVKQMLLSGIGSIVNISSIAGISAMQNRTAYSASKAGLIGFARAMAIDFAKNRIRVNCVCPGYIETDLVREYLKNLNKEEFDSLVNAHPLKRLGCVKDISQAVLFLLSSAADWITGTVLPVDGGYSMGKEC